MYAFGHSIAAVKQRAASAAVLSAALLLGATLSPTVAFAQESPPAAPPAAPAGGPPPGDPLGPDMFLAISSRNTAALSTAIKMGGKVNGTNWLGITPLMWAAMLGNADATSTLVAAGAKVEIRSPYGTALSYAAMEGSKTVVGFLLDHGATANPERVDGISPLMTAAETGNETTMRLLLAHKANANAKDGDGATPLMYAARRGQTGALSLLLKSGAAAAAKDSHERTALMYAAQNGHAPCVAVLLKAAPSRAALLTLVKQRDKTGDNALLLNARYAGSATVAQSLLRAGSDRAARDSRGRTAFEIATSHGFATLAACVAPAAASGFKTVAAVSRVSTTPLPAQAGIAAVRALALIDHSTQTFSKAAACVSCHHQGLGLMATGMAKERGFAYNVALASAQVAHIMKDDEEHAAPVHGIIGNPALYKHIPTVDMGEFAPGAGLLYSGLLAQGATFGSPQADALTVLAAQQSPSGEWGFHLHREPVQSSVFTTTALAIRLLKANAAPENAADVAKRVQSAKQWLISHQAVTSEDRAFRLLGLRWVGADAATLKKAAAEVVAAQRTDGGWAQSPLPGTRSGDSFTRSDAYATGQALYALNQGGSIPTTAAAYVRGVRYLLRTQDDDGSWFVNKRAWPVNNYFDAGFPHGESQYISYGATCWASMALMLATDPKPVPPAVAGKPAAVVTAAAKSAPIRR